MSGSLRGSRGLGEPLSGRLHAPVSADVAVHKTVWYSQPAKATLFDAATNASSMYFNWPSSLEWGSLSNMAH